MPGQAKKIPIRGVGKNPSRSGAKFSSNGKPPKTPSARSK